MSKFCSNCGSAVKEGADVCLSCGAFLPKGVQEQVPVQQVQKVKIPGNGLSIAGMAKRKTSKNITGVILNTIALIISIIMFLYIFSIA